MSGLRCGCTALLAGFLAASGYAGAQQDRLPETLKKLDQSSAKFSSAEGKFTKDLFTAAVGDHDMQTGIQYTVRNGKNSEVGIKIIGNQARTLVYKDGVARNYTPGANCFNTYSMKENKGTIESLLALSFGASGSELSSNWNIQDLGPDTVDSGSAKVQVEKLDLTPKDPKLASNVKHVALWMDLSRAVALKQVVYLPNRDTQTAVYSEIVMSKQPDRSQFEIKGKPCR